jgi:RNA polymerase sigma-70 factor (ECF subfamily)
MIAPGNEWLAERATQGDATAFGDLAERCQPLLTAYVRAHVPNWTDAEDIVQEALLDAFRGIRRFEKGRPFEPWIRAICRNRVRKFFRRAVREREMFVPLDEACLRRMEALAAEGDRGGHEVAEAVWACLGEMSVRSRMLLELRHIEGVPLAEVAARSGLSRGSAAQTLLRARRRLRLSLSRGLPA